MENKVIDEVGFEQLGSVYWQLKNRVNGGFWPDVEKIIESYSRKQNETLEAEKAKLKSDVETMGELLKEMLAYKEERIKYRTRLDQEYVGQGAILNRLKKERGRIKSVLQSAGIITSMEQIIPLHDFLTKEDLKTIENIDSSLKQLWDIVNEMRKPITPQGAFNTLPLKKQLTVEDIELPTTQEWLPYEGGWFKDEDAGIFLCIGTDKTGLTGDNQNGCYYDAGYGTQTKPTEEEVFNHLKSIAEKRYPVGTKVKCKSGVSADTIMESSFYWYSKSELCVSPDKIKISFCVIFSDIDGGNYWAEIAEPKKEWNVRLEKSVVSHFYVAVEAADYSATKDEVIEVSNLIRWVLNNKEQVLKLQNNDK